MLRFDDLQLFVRAADLGSLSAAARVMDLSPAVASAALKRIEQQLGARLLAHSRASALPADYPCSASCCLASFTTFSGVNPNFSCNLASGADAPKLFITTLAPVWPT